LFRQVCLSELIPTAARAKARAACFLELCGADQSPPSRGLQPARVGGGWCSDVRGGNDAPAARADARGSEGPCEIAMSGEGGRDARRGERVGGRAACVPEIISPPDRSADVPVVPFPGRFAVRIAAGSECPAHAHRMWSVSRFRRSARDSTETRKTRSRAPGSVGLRGVNVVAGVTSQLAGGKQISWS
jgi:hypothetical protein